MEDDCIIHRSCSLFLPKCNFSVTVKMETIYSTPRQREVKVSRSIIITVLNTVNIFSQFSGSFMRDLLHLLADPWVPPMSGILWKRGISYSSSMLTIILSVWNWVVWSIASAFFKLLVELLKHNVHLQITLQSTVNHGAWLHSNPPPPLTSYPV